MISLNLTDALTLYLAASLLFIFLVWAFFNRRESRKKPPPNLFELAICEYCDFPYLAKTIHKLHRCPRCELMNQENWYRKK